MRTIKTSTGNVYEIRFCGKINQGERSVLFIEFMHEEFLEIVSRFTDQAETSVIYSYVDGEPEYTFIGYTNLTEAIVLEGGNIRIRLETSVDESESGGEL